MDSTDGVEDARTLYCGNLSNKVTEELLYELFLQAGPLERVRIPNDREGRPQSFGFITFKHQCSVQYALSLFDGVSLYNCRLNIKFRNADLNNSAMCNMYQQMGAHVNSVNVTNMNSATYNRTPSGRHDYLRQESLQGRWSHHQNKFDRDMKPNDTRRNNYKRRKR